MVFFFLFRWVRVLKERLVVEDIRCKGGIEVAVENFDFDIDTNLRDLFSLRCGTMFIHTVKKLITIYI